jgi:hypothetical protein
MAMAMAVQCGTQASFVSAVSSRSCFRKNAGRGILSVRNPKRIGSFTGVCTPIVRAKSDAKFSGKVQAQAQPQSASDGVSVAEGTNFKHVLFPIIMDRNPYLSEATRQAAASTTALATKFGADITVVVIDDEKSESQEDHDTRMKNIRWHLAEGGFEEFKLMERAGDGKRPAVVIGEIADDMNLDLVVLSMEAIHAKHIDSNLLAEFVPCPVLLLPL